LNVRACPATGLKRHNEQLDIMTVFLGDQPLHPHLATEVPGCRGILCCVAIDFEALHGCTPFLSASPFRVGSGPQHDGSRSSVISHKVITFTLRRIVAGALEAVNQRQSLVE